MFYIFRNFSFTKRQYFKSLIQLLLPHGNCAVILAKNTFSKTVKFSCNKIKMYCDKMLYDTYNIKVSLLENIILPQKRETPN